jgi:hypothetical protein
MNSHTWPHYTNKHNISSTLLLRKDVSLTPANDYYYILIFDKDLHDSSKYYYTTVHTSITY